jgi:hypothetical protein
MEYMKYAVISFLISKQKIRVSELCNGVNNKMKYHKNVLSRFYCMFKKSGPSIRLCTEKLQTVILWHLTVHSVPKLQDDA